MQDLADLAVTGAKYAAAAGGVGILLKSTFFTVAQETEGLVSRFGKYTGTPRTTGLNFKVPFIDKVDQRVPLALQTIPMNLDAKTKDEQFVKLPVSLQFTIEDTAKYHYKTRDPETQIKEIVSKAVRNYVNTRDFNELYSEAQADSDEAAQTVASRIEDDLNDYGIVIRRIVIEDPEPDQNTKDAYNDVRASERRKDAARNNAEAKKIEMVETARADKERNELMGEGIKSFRKSIAESYIETRAALIDAGVDETAADAFMAEAMRLDTMRDVGEKGNLIVMALDSAGADTGSIPSVMAALKAHDRVLNDAAPEQNNKPAQMPAKDYEEHGNAPEVPEM